MNSEPYGFREQLEFSQGVALTDELEQHLLAAIPGSTGLRRPTTEEDLDGTDLWILRSGLPPVSVDYKHRTFDPIDRFGTDDVCIETCSVYRNRRRVKPGWTIDATKRTDLLVYTWPADEARRFWVVYFPFLCRAAIQHLVEWQTFYGEKPTPNNGYQTLNIYVPRRVVTKAILELTRGLT